MKHFWKRFAEWVSCLRNDLYLRTRVQLTVIYFLSTVVIVFLFQIFFSNDYVRYLRAISENQGVSSDRIAGRVERAHFIFTKSLLTLDPSDVVTIFMAVGIGYFLSGMVLRSLKQMIRRQQRFLSDASHELKTPLTILKTEMEVFLRSKPKYIHKNEYLMRRRSSVESNLAEIDRMSEIVEGLLFMERIDVNQEVFEMATINIVHLLAGVVRSLRPYARRDHIRLSLIPSHAILVDVDINKMRRVFTNVLKNAIDYSGPNGNVVDIAFSESPSWVETRITDHGIGIAAHDLSRVFDPFYRGGRVLTYNQKGTGLGLAIVKKIVEHHKGKVHIESRINHHTTVSILLPRSSS